MSSTTGETVKVAVRIRPLVQTEENKGCQNIIQKIPKVPQIIVSKKVPFTFNYVFTPESCQETIYESAVKGLVRSLFNGYNVTVLAYGQTGSGKTHTMGTSFSGEFDADSGIIPRSMDDIFEFIQNMSDHDFKVTCTFMELYKEQLFDLLSDSSREHAIVDIREDLSGNAVVPGATEILVTSAHETLKCLHKGSSRRAVAATAMNAQSSRSHAIFSLNVQMSKHNDASTTTSAKFHLVDLAGSERPKKTLATGERFKEGVTINKGLLALGNVISALGCAQTAGGYVGYRDSKLTRLLQDSLGGNSKTLMIACVSPADYNGEETLSTLRYADRARKIKNKPIVNQDPQLAEINRLNGVVQDLRLRLLSYEDPADARNDINSKNILSLASGEQKLMQKELQIINEKYVKVQQQLQVMLDNVADIELITVVYENSHEELVKKFADTKSKIIEKFKESNRPMEVKEQELLFENITSYLQDYDDKLQMNCTEIQNKKNSSLSMQNDSSADCKSLDSNELLQMKVDAFNNKQLDFNSALQRINRELNLKEELHQKMVGNLNEFTSYDGNAPEKFTEFESLIKTLETERDELNEKLKSVQENVSAKLAEERRKRLQQLEKQINDLQKKNLQQAKMLKVKEKDSKKISNLSSEIQAMKAAKVKLIRAMKQESDNFRQWKLNREKEVTQLKEKDRKRQNEMARMEMLHSKQKSVLKRKVEESMAINKKLKDALEKQRLAQIQRTTSATGKPEQICAWVDQELEVIFSVVDAQILLEHLMEDRADLNTKFKEMKRQTCVTSELDTLEEEIETRNAQINDLQQKIVENDIQAKIKSLCGGISAIPQLRSAVKHLFSIAIEMRKEFSALEGKFEDARTLYEISEFKVSALEEDLKAIAAKYTEEKTIIEKYYEEKIIVLLRELNQPGILNGDKAPQSNERIRIQEETLDKVERLTEELTIYKMKCEKLEAELVPVKGVKMKKPLCPKIAELSNNTVKYVDITSSEDDEYFASSDSDDPDWRNTPMAKRRQKIMKDNESAETESSALVGIKRSSDGTIRCSCKGNCGTRLCTCRKRSGICSEQCKCSDRCLNRATIPASDECDEEKENDVLLKKTKILDPVILNATTPSYPYSTKPRKPFFDRSPVGEN